MLLRKYSEAVDLFTQSIRRDEDSYLGYSKRAAALEALGKLKEAVVDLDVALKKKPDHEKSALKKAQLLVQLGRYEQVFVALQSVKSASAEVTQLRELAQRLLSLQNALEASERSQDWAGALRFLDQMIAAGANRDLLAVERCKIAFNAGNYYDVVAEAMSLLKRDASNTEALLIRSRAFFRLGELDACTNHLKQCVKVQPDHAGCEAELKVVREFAEKRDKAMELVKNQQWVAAIAPLRVAITEAKGVQIYVQELSLLLCEAFEKGGTTIEMWKEGVEACSSAVAMSDSMKEFRGNLHQKLGNWQEAIQDFSAILQSQPGNMRMRQKLQEVQNAKKIAERKDYYKILDVPRDATQKQIRTQFRKLALQWHPDKFDTAEDREKANKMFTEINEAYDVLSTEEKKARFDRGEDVEGQQQHQHHWAGFNPFGGQQFTFRFQ